VGRFYFNQLSAPCFTLSDGGRRENRCTERNWWGSCKKKEMMPVAEWKEPLKY
jgi:hypothetical protein